MKEGWKKVKIGDNLIEIKYFKDGVKYENI